MKFNFFSKNVTLVKLTDKIFVNTVAKQAACIQLAKADETVVFIAWFDDTTHAFRNLFSLNNIPEGRILQAKALHTGKIDKHIPVFLEHFPLAADEQELVKNWPLEKVGVFSALDEPLFQRFGGDKIKELLLKLGLQEDEAIEHPLISKAIINGQSNLAKKVNFPATASSQQAWFEKNIDGKNFL